MMTGDNLLAGILYYCGSGIMTLAAAFVLVHAYNESMGQFLLIMGSAFIAYFIGPMIGIPPFLEGLIASIFFLIYFFTRYERESKGFILGMYALGLVVQIVGIIMR
ncbi:MAG: hypothetical protein HZB31_09495 [Nitrospirae bacterium]|nr:hypothetical protein [Nitrospirota bacterium]